jgi:hypothetical protein
MYIAVEERTARPAPKSVSHFVFSKLICPSERTPPTSPKILKMGRRKSAVTKQEKTVSCADEGEMYTQANVILVMAFVS